MSLDDKLSISRFQQLAGTGDAAVEGDMIVGRFGRSPLVITNAIRLVEEIANIPDTPVRILEFTRRYAPLMEHAKPDTEFRFEICTWQSWRQTFRNTWKAVAALSPKDRTEKYLDFPKGTRLICSRLGTTIQQERFLDLINLCFAGLPLERVRVCPAPECKKPYFVATHLKQTYCGSQACITWGKRQRELKHWNRNKDEYLAERRRERAKNRERKKR